MFDVAIVGGGLIGQALAIALKNSGLKIALIEASRIQHSQSDQELDRRSIALTPKTADILTSLGVFVDLEAHCTRIDHIHVSNKGYLGFTRIHASDEGLESLGYIVLLDHLAFALAKHLPPNLTLYSPSVLQEINYDDDHATLTLTIKGEVQTLQARLVVGADGAQSFVRQSLHISAKNIDYDQTAIVGNMRVSEPHAHWAYERFTSTGPFAILPGQGQSVAFVWTVQTDQAQELLSLDPAAFLLKAQEVFGYRMGRFLAVGGRASYPLRLVAAHTLFSKRAILIGNAAQSLHPVAGQGFNLGLRDVAECSHCMMQSGVNDVSWLKDYEQLRLADREKIIQTTHALVKGFSHTFGLLHGVSSTLMAILERCPALKSRWNRRFMGQVKGARSPLFNTF